MKLNQLKPAEGAKKARRRVGRGLGSGRGKTAGRGQKGQKSRSGYSASPTWEGGRSRLFERLPKRGFNNNRFKTFYQIVNVEDLNEKFGEGAEVNAQSLRDAGLIRRLKRPIKLLGNGELEVRGLQVHVDAYSKSAVKAIETAGGIAHNAPSETESASEAEQ